MHRAALFVLRLLGFRRPRPTTRWGWTWRRAERVILAVTLAYLGLQAFPQLLFAHSVEAGGITLYARHALPPSAVGRLIEARRLVDASELAVAGRRERVFVCDSPWMFRLFALASPGAFAVSVPLTNRIFIAAADFDADLAHAFRPEHPTRPLAGTIAHEITHGLIRRHLGLVHAARLPEWIAEGYPEFVAGSGSLPPDVGRRLLIADQTDPSPAFRYFRAGQMVRHLAIDEHLSFDRIVARARDEAAVAAATRAALQEQPAASATR